MRKHILNRFHRIIKARIGSLIEEVEIATNVKLNQSYVIDLKDEIASLQWVTRVFRWILDQAIDIQQHLGITKTRLEFII